MSNNYYFYPRMMIIISANQCAMEPPVYDFAKDVVTNNKNQGICAGSSPRPWKQEENTPTYTSKL